MESLAEELDWAVKMLLNDKVQMIHGVGECESPCLYQVTGDGFFKIPSFYAYQRACARKVRTSVASAGSVGNGYRAALTGQPQGSGTEGRVIARPFRGRGYFHEVGNLPINSLPFYSTTSIS